MAAALKAYYSPNNYVDPHFICKSTNVPLTNAKDSTGHISIPKNNAYRKMPWNYLMNSENVSRVFIGKSPNSSFSMPSIYIININGKFDRLAELTLHLEDKLNLIKTCVVEAIVKKPGYLGCALSHIKVLKHAREQGLPFVIVAEDDFMPLIPNFERRLLTILKWCHDNLDKWEVFNSIPLGYSFDKIDKVLSHDAGIVRVVGGCNTQFVIYNKNCYDRLISYENNYQSGTKFLESGHAWDVVLSRSCEMITAYPFLTNSFAEDSSIVPECYVGDQCMRNFEKMLEWDKGNLHYFKADFDKDSDVTMIMTSCHRYPELVRTLDSFLKFNSYPLKKIIISEENFERYFGRFYERYSNLIDEGWLSMVKGKGSHMGSLTMLYNMVDTPYFFHMEEDWECVRPFFIEQSMIILKNNQNVMNVWLRDLNDTNKHPVGEHQKIGGINCFKMSYDYNKHWHGFTFNPTLMRASDRVNLLGFESQAAREGGLAEEKISEHYKSIGKYAVILPVAHFYHTGYYSTYGANFLKR